MLSLFRNNSPYTVIILFITALLLKLQALVHPVAPVALPNQLVYGWIMTVLNNVMNGNAFGYTFLSVILLFGQGLFLTSITIQHRLFPKPSYLPAFVYVILTSLLPAFNFFSATLLVNWLLLAGLNTILKFTQPINPRKHIFNAGFILGVAGLVQFSALGYLLLFLLTILLLRPINVGEWVVSLFGYLTPIYFLLGILFLIDKMPLMHHWMDVGISLPRQIKNPVYSMGLITGLILVISCGLYVLQDQLSGYPISVRRGWGAIGAYAITSLPVAIFTPQQEQGAWLCMLPSLALFIVHPMCLEKSRRFSNFIFYFLIVMVLFCQLAIRK